MADSVLTVSLSELRRALGETARAATYIATEHRRGYHFIAPVNPLEPPVPLAVSTELEQAGEEMAGALTPSEPERRQLNVLFCELVDSTTLAGHLDLERIPGSGTDLQGDLCCRHRPL